ncbi:diguanylate cyclase domain-containing protein [Marinobacterium lutimaris]|uniref:Diguanylate cyclase (GGDEF) domain-containing protein n=1 Tax=Marinobacterium lutimaris TaxID=568106 RepID=A0A1H6APA4_9GAMM|nr:diguanylate cyclase [Marinobacterium lutimaris]SEG49907.1 diguanylate cyclase (GGDEF) domain-containing protein [Marinobacterium lutimaris]
MRPTGDSGLGRAALTLPDYELISVLERSGDRVTFRARRRVDGMAVALETIDVEFPSRQQVARIRREGVIAQRLSDVEGVRRVHEVIAHGSGNLALVTELYGSNLAHLLQSAPEHRLPVHEVLALGLRLVQILGGIHARDIVHKALTPAHVLLDPASDGLALSGFGIASELDQERQAVQMSRSLEGPLPYMSPEQTGRMNRDLDYRSDYYSLGVLLYEMLTGQLPFQEQSLLEWVHSHISRLPRPPHEIQPDVPAAVSAIVLKLLAKSPEARYQSAAGLSHDLEHCAQQLAAGSAIEPFELSEKDGVQKFLIPQTLYGRERELGVLLDLFESAVAGGNEFCLVHGYSGVGKSALVNEIDRPLVRERGFLVQGKFDQFQSGEAYRALGSAFRSLVQQVLAEPEERLEQWRLRLQTALGPNARLVIDLVPELELVIGPQPAVASLPPAEARNRLQIVLTAFLQVFAGQGHPVVLFLDDLQWSDLPTLELLRRFVSTHDLTHLLLIGAYRSNEVSAAHPLRLMLEELEQKREIRQLPLGPLQREAVAQLVAGALCREVAQAQPLSDMLFDKAQGNPFSTNELLRQLNKEGVIFADPASGYWRWDMDAARWASVSDDVVRFMVDNLRKLEPETQKVLQLAACIGNTFDLRTLATIYEDSIDATAAALLPALKQHTVLPLHSDYRLFGGRPNSEDSDSWAFSPSYRFQHDRVQQAAYALIDADHLDEVHLSIGRLMLKDAGDSLAESRLIDIVGHLNEGRALITDAGERLHLASLNLKAGIRARHSSAYQAALDYLVVARQLLPEDPWSTVPEMMFELAEETQQCAYLNGHAAEAEHWIEVMLERAGSDLERADILATRTRQCVTLGRMEESILAAIQGLAVLGVEFTHQPTEADIRQEQQRVLEYLAGRKIADLVSAPEVDDEAVLTAMRLLNEIFAAAFLSGSGNLFPYLVLKAVNLSLRYGNCPESAFAYAAYGMLLCGELDEPALGYQYGRVGLELNERLDDLPLRARVIYVYAMFVHHWSNHWSSLTPLFRRGIEAGYQSGDLLYLAYSAQDCVIWDPTMDLESAERLHAENLEIVRECAYQDSLDSGTLFLQMQRNLLGRTDSPFSLSDADFDEQQCLEGMRQRQFMTGIANYHIYNAEISLIHGDYERAYKHVREQDKLIKSAMSLPQLTRFYILACLTLARYYPTMDEPTQLANRARMESDLARMTRWADNCEANFRHLQYLMQAELAALDELPDTALECYERSIDAAREAGFLRDEAMASEAAARYLLSLGRRRCAEGYLRAAYCLYERWGAVRKVKMMRQEFAVLRELVPAQTSLHSATGIDAGDLDLASVMKASREISGEMVLERLLKKSMDILLESAGGQWGCLVVRQHGLLRIEALRVPERTQPVPALPEHSRVAMACGDSLPLPVTLISEVLSGEGAVVLDDAAREGAFLHDPYVRAFRPASVLCVPVRRERFEGVLYMENNLSSGVFTKARVELIKLLAAQAAVAIDNARLYEQVQEYSHLLEEKVAERTARLEQLNLELQGLVDRDGLTGVANRRRGDSYLDEVWVRLRREGDPLSVIMLDVDHFKAFNDNYGHQAGDYCLSAVAGALKAQLLRPGDLVARYGGEEFIVILPNTHKEGARDVGEKIRRAIEALEITHEHSSAGPVVTISAGFATAMPCRGGSSIDLVHEADQGLYKAKQQGRNRVRSIAPASAKGAVSLSSSGGTNDKIDMEQ